MRSLIVTARCGASILAALAIFIATAEAEPRAAQTVHFTVDAARNLKPISRYIYGTNGPLAGPSSNRELARNIAFTRLGGNRWTAYNWVNNASNAGSDWFFQNDDFLGGGDVPGGAVIPRIDNARKRNAGVLLTIPINGYVAADKNGGGDVRNSGPDYLQTRFRQGRPVKGAPFTLTPDPSNAFVYQDEFVNWVKTNYPYSQQAGTDRPIWFSLDNEPDLWNSTHAEVHPDPATYAEMIKKTTDYALGIKAVTPNALVFGPVSYGFNGYISLQNAPDANGRDFLGFYLKKMLQAEGKHGKRLLDVLDLHWYPEARGGGVRITEQNASPEVVAARLQAPRSLWDTSYRETSWIADDWYNGPIYLLPRLFRTISRSYPNTRLAFTEYNYGGGAYISGGIAQADVLGIFGRDGVFAANQWQLHADERFVNGGFNMYRDFDGNGGRFGDTSVHAQTDNVADTSIYASTDSTNPNRMVLVAINKTAQSIKAVIRVRNPRAVTNAAVYQLTGQRPWPRPDGNIALTDPGRFSYTMPPYSVTTLNLTNN